MRLVWREGDRTREVEVTALGGLRYRAVVDGIAIEADVRPLPDGRLRISTEDRSVAAEVTRAGERRFVRLGSLDFVLDREPAGRRRGAAAHGGGLEAPMPGLVTRVLVEAGEAVKKGQPLIAIEAMKMEHVIRAPRDGRVARVGAAQGDMVQGGVALVELEESG